MLIAVIRTIILYLLIILGIRLLGKRQIGELEPSELVLSLIIADLAAVPMQDFGIPLLMGIIPILTLLCLSAILSVLTEKNIRFRALLCSRPSIVIQDGKVLDSVEEIGNSEWRQGLQMEQQLHQLLVEKVTVDTTFEELYDSMNGIIAKCGFLNLDFAGNLGHSIVKNKNDRIYIEKGNKAKLSAVKMFTFEPHIGMPGSKYGYKREDIYYFEDGKLKKL